MKGLVDQDVESLAVGSYANPAREREARDMACEAEENLHDIDARYDGVVGVEDAPGYLAETYRPAVYQMGTRSYETGWGGDRSGPMVDSSPNIG